jgi:1-acyl-sn-glycerol-3-phosphate acyltransferase
MWPLGVCALALAVLLAVWLRSGEPWFDFLEHRVMYLFARIWHRWSSNGPAPLPATGPALLIANHPSHADPAFLMAGCRRRLNFMQARECYEVCLLRCFFRWGGCIPVARDGHDVAALRQTLARLQQGEVICIFPEGEVEAWHGQENHVHRGMALLALRSRAPVFPAFIMGGPRRNSILGEWLLPSSGVRVLFGPGIDLTAYYGRHIDRKLLDEVTGLLRRRIEELRPPVQAPVPVQRRRQRCQEPLRM